MDIIKADLYRYNKLSGVKGLLRGLMIPGFRYMFLMRLATSHSNRKSIKRIFYKLLLRRYVYKYGIQIPVSAKIGEGFYIGHFGSIVVSENAVIGNNCNIAHSVTIGQTRRGSRKGAPVIGNNVWIGTGSVIVGKITIGNNVLIAPLTYLTIDVPDNCMVMGNPAKIIEKENATEGHINNVLRTF
ncbi:serine O-acetyltransferase [Pontibacter aydingkolensis]|uniref:Serine acetyltransferase n=1 Tax=Pontibacter aydingkolensis TaxID=1911536 RepID=A0ABS7CVE7_9BACT|nr:serine acetyltransferase [Pontibacter aydingkolensis]MBW7467671.1 serine acetyltransferase [Pontibacter aydingkolensis]